MTITTAKTAGRKAPHWSIVALTVAGILGAAPFALGAFAGGKLTLAAVPVLVPVSRPAAAPKPAGPETAIVQRTDARTLLSMFKDKDYRVEAVRDGLAFVPRVVLADLPADMAGMDSIDDRKALFVKALLPLILMVNEDIQRDRERIALLHRHIQSGNAPAPQDLAWLTQTAEHYGLETKGAVDTAALLVRVDAVPPSLALAQAVEESGWGTSRIAQDGNALFGQLTWNARHAGIAPRNRQPGENHRYRAFEDPLDSVRSYVHNLNTHRAYKPFRLMRASMRKQDKPLDGPRLAGALESYSERGVDYVKTIRTVMRVNDLTDFDRAVLEGPPPAPQVEAAVRPPGR